MVGARSRRTPVPPARARVHRATPGTWRREAGPRGPGARPLLEGAEEPRWRVVTPPQAPTGADDKRQHLNMNDGAAFAAPSDLLSHGAYGEGTRTGQLGAATPLESAQLIRPFGAAFTTGVSGELAVT